MINLNDDQEMELKFVKGTMRLPTKKIGDQFYVSVSDIYEMVKKYFNSFYEKVS